VSLFGKQSRNSTANVTCTPGNQYPHKNDCPFLSSFGTLEVYYNRAWPEGQVASGQMTPGLATASPKTMCSALILPDTHNFRHTVLKRGQRASC
jgi:hypothetical protein